MYKYTGPGNAISMAKFIHKHAEIKFELKEKFFSTEENESEAPVMMDMQEGNINPKPEQI